MCTQIIYKTGPEKFITGRSMDWNDSSAKKRVIVYPRGLQQSGGTIKNGLDWTSKYGSIFSSFYDKANVDGINERGLAGNVLYLAEADYGDSTKSDKLHLSVGAWNQYFLDNFATVKEAVAAMKQPLFIIDAPILPNGHTASVHLALSDSTGDSAIFEYLNGELVIHHSHEHDVKTNSLTYDDNKHYSESTFQSGVFWLDIDKVNLQEGAPIMSVEVNAQTRQGDVTDKLTSFTQLEWL